MGYIFPHVPGPLPQALSCLASSSGAGVDAGCLSRLWVQHQQCRRVTFVPKDTLTQPGLPLPFAAGGGWGPPLPGAAGVAACVVDAAQCGAKGGPLPPGETCVLGPVAMSLPGSLLSGQCSPPLSSRTRLLLGISKASQLRKLCLAFWASFQAGALTGFAAFPWSRRLRLLLLRAQPPVLYEAGQGLQGSSPRVCVPLDGAARHFIAHLTAHDPLCVPLRLDQDGACCRRAAVSSCRAG